MVMMLLYFGGEKENIIHHYVCDSVAMATFEEVLMTARVIVIGVSRIMRSAAD